MVTSVHKRAWGSKCPKGSRMRTQRNGTTGLPGWYQTAVSDVMSNGRMVPSYQGAATLVHVVWEECSRVWRVGRRSPLRRGRPFCPGVRGGAGS